MAERAAGSASIEDARARLPLEDLVETMNDRLGLYLSEEQQRGLAVGLLVGIVLGSAVAAWGAGTAVRRRVG